MTLDINRIQLIIQEYGYHFTRYLFSLIYRYLLNDYETVVNAGQNLGKKLKISHWQAVGGKKLHDLNISRDLFDLSFNSPVTFAAFESNLDLIYLWLNLGIGGGCLKTIKVNESLGNKRPRLQQVYIDKKEHLINALGLPGPGIHELINKIKGSQLPSYASPIGISIGGASLDDYQQVLLVLAKDEEALGLTQLYYEINISCPNTETGKSMHDNLDEIETFIKYARSLTQKVIVIKVSPDATDTNLCDIAACVKAYDKVTINAGNTSYRSCHAVGLKETAISIGGGGLSGPVLYKRTYEMAKLLSQFKLPLIATGGISNCDQINDLSKFGVQIVGMATQLVQNPYAIPTINTRLSY